MMRNSSRLEALRRMARLREHCCGATSDFDGDLGDLQRLTTLRRLLFLSLIHSRPPCLDAIQVSPSGLLAGLLWADLPEAFSVHTQAFTTFGGRLLPNEHDCGHNYWMLGLENDWVGVQNDSQIPRRRSTNDCRRRDHP